MLELQPVMEDSVNDRGAQGRPIPPLVGYFPLARQERRDVVRLRDAKNAVNHAGTAGNGAPTESQVTLEGTRNGLLQAHPTLMPAVSLERTVAQLRRTPTRV
ncbi:MAG: hypothetical protein ACLQAT_27405 [Candidatus Binataceae bacterium]